jgi:hypothetical protein
MKILIFEDDALSGGEKVKRKLRMSSINGLLLERYGD